MGRFCGSTASKMPIYSKTNRMIVTFTSDESVKGRGFKAVYKGFSFLFVKISSSYSVNPQISPV